MQQLGFPLAAVDDSTLPQSWPASIGSPVKYRIHFKILLITFKAHLGLAPSYTSNPLTPYEPGRSLGSSGGVLITVPQSRLKSKAEHTFAVRAPKLWNALPAPIRLADSAASLRSLLKTHVYIRALL